jgi:predicted metalloprotease with PDZ domain
MSTLRYRLSVPSPETHLVAVELELVDAAALGDAIVLEMAAWCPGSYFIRDYARYVRDVSATGDDGVGLAVVQLDKRRFSIARGQARRVVVRYQVYGHELSVRTNHIDASHALLHGPGVYLFPTAARDRACRVEVVPPADRGWRIHTGLAAADGGAFSAANVDELLDCPIHLGVVEERTRTAGGKPLRLAVWGQLAARQVELDKLADDLAVICDAHARRMGGVPYEAYTFVLMLSPGAYGGLEHMNSSVNLHTPFCLASTKAYHELLELLSHEYFHLWNGKRIYPAVLERIDYGRENETRCLWVVEGLTSYYDRLTVRLADRIPVAGFLAKLAEEWGRLVATPGRRRHSMEDASLNAWQKLYKPDESNLNTTVSYYLKGGIVAAAFDLEIRKRSNGARSLDDVLRHLWRRYGLTGEGYPEDVQREFEEGAGVALGDLFDRLVRGTDDPALAEVFADVGLQLRSSHEARPDDGVEPAWIGALMMSGGVKVAAVVDDSPAQRAGLSPGDDVIAVDRYQVLNEGDLRTRLSGYRPGGRCELSVFRRFRLEQVVVEIGAMPHNRFEIVSRDNVDDAQRAGFRAWLGVDHPGARLAATATVPVGI